MSERPFLSDQHPKAKTFWHSVSCIPGCAGCCPNTCECLDPETRLCTVHPNQNRSLREAWSLHFGQGCPARPIELFASSFGCPVIVEILQHLLNKEIPTTYTDRGQIILTDYQKTVQTTRRARGFVEKGEKWPPEECIRHDVEQIRNDVMTTLHPLLSQGIHNWR